MLPRDARERGLTLPETVVVGATLVALLALISMAITAVRDQLKRQQAWALLRQLDAACDAYRRVNGAWPVPDTRTATRPGVRGRAAFEPAPDDAQGPIELMAATQPSRELLDRIDLFLKVPDPRPQAYGTFRDPWGTRLHCLTASSPSPLDRQAVTAQGGKPIFVSASQDRAFVGPDGSAAADNLRTDELPP
jgi:hypothetical protein